MSTMHLTAGSSEFTLEIGTERHLIGAHLFMHVGGDDYREDTSVYEADKGFIILEALPQINSQWGDCGYSTQLTGRDANIEKVEKITKIFDEAMKQAQKNNDRSNESSFSWIQKQVLDYYFKFTSANAHFECHAHAKSHTVRIPLPWPLDPTIDTKTAQIDIQFTFRVLKLIAPEEMSLLDRFLTDATNHRNKVVVKFSN